MQSYDRLLATISSFGQNVSLNGVSVRHELGRAKEECKSKSRMERKMSQSGIRSPSSSHRKEVSSGNYLSTRVVGVSVVLTGVFLVCFVSVLNGTLSANHGTLSANHGIRSTEWGRCSSEGLEQDLKFGDCIKGRHDRQLLQVADSPLSAERKVKLASATNSSKKQPQSRAKNSYIVTTNISTGMISVQKGAAGNPLYHNFALFERDYAEMEKRFRIFVYPEAYGGSGESSHIFLPHRNPESKNIGNYYSEHKFKITLLKSKFVTNDSAEAHLFYLPFSVNVMRNDFSVRTEPAIIQFVKSYIENVSREYDFWNRSLGADHFFACCHSVGRDVPQALPALRHNAIQLVCSSNYYYKNYLPHKDVALPQVWPRKALATISPPEKRYRLAFYAGRIQNSNIRKLLIDVWGADPDLDFFAGGSNGSYETHFEISKFCVHVRGYEVNTARISDAIHFGCVPIIISEYYDIPLGDTLDWSQFSIIVSFTRIPDLKKILEGVTKEQYAVLHENVLKVRKHFQWNDTPQKYDAFGMSMYQLWLKRFVLRESADS